MRTVDPEKYARRRSQIIEAAAVEFALHGVDGASTAGICRRARIGSGTLFHYFPTKIDIFHALFRDDLQRNAQICAEVLSQPAQEGLDRLVDHRLADFRDPLDPALLDGCYLSAGDDDFDAGTATAELQHHDQLTAGPGRPAVSTSATRRSKNRRSAADGVAAIAAR